VALELTANRYRCTAYEDYAGAVWAEGEFVALCGTMGSGGYAAVLL
jgi:hypothetical protein